MESPRIDGLHVTETIGAGVTGAVYAAEDELDNKVAVKVFQGMAIHRQLLQKMTLRLEAGDWPRGVMPIISANFEARPALRVTADYRDDDGHPSSLQHRWGKDSSLVPWDFIRELAQALASMHSRQVAHGNLKPGNIFFGESGELLLSDWTLGHMPGISHLDYTDALLYQAPEQLLHPEGYLEEAGYRWDVFAFATLSFRLLTGMFPRCDETFSKVAPAFGDAKRENIVADTHRIAASLQTEAIVSWPAPATNSREQDYRDLLMQCLRLEPHERPASMAEVSRTFEEIDFRHDAEEHRDKLLDQSRRSRRNVSLLTILSGALLACFLITLFNGIRTKSSLATEKSDRAAETTALRNTASEAIAQKNHADQVRIKEVATADAQKNQAEQTLNNERLQWIEKLRASREVGDQLFAWAMAKGHRTLPPLDDRETRLKLLESYYQQFLREAALLPELAEEKARAQWQLAEIALAQSDAEKAATLLEKSLPEIEKHKHDATWQLRIATGRLQLALLWQKKGDERCDNAFAEARAAIAALPQTGIDLDRVKQLSAILDYQQASRLAEKGEAAKALEQLMSATTLLNELADVHPEVTVLRAELANCYLNSATILEGMGSMGDARETRVLAVNELLTQLKKNPNDFDLRLSLASTYGAMAETSMLAGDVSSADQLSQNAIKLLEALYREQPKNALVATRLASQRLVVASLLEDRGETAKASGIVDNGIMLLKGIISTENPDPLACFHYARLLWEKGRILSVTTSRKEGLDHYQQAQKLLESLGDHDHGTLRAEHVLRHLGYLYSDTGHLAQVDKANDLAKKNFAASIVIWEKLLKLQDKNEEYRELLQWSQSRLKEL